ncbi:MAG: nucleoside monophosphate kinase [Planctomycetaceae bacterium]|nr:nucleoside monophosphate kinase [Planctomycetaceae bacterium]
MTGHRFPAALIFGVPGAGKGTQGDILTRIPGFFHCSTGVIFRRMDPDSEDGRLVREYSSRGELAPDEVTVRIWRTWIDAQRAIGQFLPRKELLLLDGIPRTVQQCEMMEEHIDVKVVVHLVCKDIDAMIERIRRRAMLENRPDDLNDDVTRRRFDVYEEETAPVLGYYPPGIIKEVESTRIVPEVLKDSLIHLVPVLKAEFPRA